MLKVFSRSSLSMSTPSLECSLYVLLRKFNLGISYYRLAGKVFGITTLHYRIVEASERGGGLSVFSLTCSIVMSN